MKLVETLTTGPESREGLADRGPDTQQNEEQNETMTTKSDASEPKRMKTFNIGTISEPVTFAVDDEEFEAIPANRLPAGSLAKYFAAINESKIFEAQELFFAAVLTEESNKRFTDRLNSTDKPIPMKVMGDVAAWLLGDVYLQGEVTEDPKPS